MWQDDYRQLDLEKYSFFEIRKIRNLKIVNQKLSWAISKSDNVNRDYILSVQLEREKNNSLNL